MSQVALAEAVGVRQPTMWRYEKAGVTPSAEVLEAIARELGVSTHWLLHGTEAPARSSAPRPDPKHWAEFLANYPNIAELSDEDLEDIKAFAGRRGSKVETWMGWAEIAEWVRRSRPSAIFESKT